MARRPPKPLTVKELEAIKTMKASGLTYNAIGKELCRDPKTVNSACIEPATAILIEEQKQELSEMFESLAKRLLTSISDADILKINSYQRVVSAGISTDKMRLLNNESTQNFKIHELVQSLDDLDSQLCELEKEKINGEE